MKNASFILLVALVLFLWTCREIDSVTPNFPPIAVAGENFSVLAGEVVAVDGSESTDPDGDSLSYTWTFLAKPVGSKAGFNDFDSVRTTFIADKDGVYKIKLVVSDNVSTSADTLDVGAIKGNGSPTVNAGNNGQVDLGTQFQLAGSATDPDGNPLTITWTLQSKPAGSAAAIQNPGSLNALFVVDKHGTYVARLQVSDGTFTVNDEITITTIAVSVTTINPTSGPRGITVKIAGKNFSSTPSENTVTFNGAMAVVSASSYTSIDAVVPKGAGTGPVAVRVNAITSTGPVFTYILSPTVSTVSQFNSPFSIASDVNGNLYISDFNSHVIRRLTPAGVLTTFAGTGQSGYTEGKLLAAQFNKPAGIVIDSANANLYVVDNGNHCIRRISIGSGVVSTFAGFPQAGYADGKGSTAQFNGPNGLAMDASRNLFVGDTGNGRVRKISTSAVVSTVAPNSPVFNGVAGVAVDANNNIYVAEALSHRIQKITPQLVVSTLAGSTTSGFVNGTGAAARFNVPYSVTCDASGNVFVADFNNHSIRKITPAGVTTTVSGTGVAGYVEGSTAQFNQPIGLHVRPNGNIYVADFGNQRVRLIIFE